HVQRLLRARVERPALDKPMPATESSPAVSELNRDRRLEDVGTSVVVLKRRRPIVGMVLDGIGESVVIKRIEKNSPADKAGLKVGDVVQAVEGIRIRSVYQAVTPVLYKQPGDIVAYEVLQGETARRVEVTLGGGVELPSAPAEVLGSFIRPKVDIEGVGKGLYYTRSAKRTELREVAAPSDAPLASDEKKLNSSTEQILLLEKALDSYRAVITYQQGQLSQRDDEHRAAEEQIKRLETQLEKLKATPASPSR
ncbi:MAG TPA: PDZ domain-containing protein, partial [Pirellulaceae bacterium]|nr:PDZ domain-containing protein [Pirellulaceae bacterium]